MADKSIGYAVLQIIPSLKGVSDAINKEITGKPITVTIDPQIDPKTIDKAVQDSVKKSSKPPEIELQPKVEAKKVDKAVQDSVKKSKPPEIKIEPKVDESKTKKVGDSLKDIITDAVRDAGWEVDDLVQEAAKKVGGKIGQVIGDSRVGHWVQDVAEKVQDVRDRVSAATDGFGHMSDAIGALKSGDAASGLNGISNALNAIGQSSAGSTIATIANEVAPLQTQFYALKDGISGVGSMIETLASGSERYGGKFAALGAAVSEFAGPLAMAAAAAAGVAWGLNQIAQAPDPTKGFQSPIRGHEGAPVIPVPGSAPLVVTPPAPPGTHYVQTPGSLDPFAALLPAGSAPPPTAAAVLPPSGVVPDMTRFMHPDMPGNAGGGLISGPGSGTSDSILGWPAMVRVSNKEFVTNAEDTQKNLPLLHAVNSGAPLWDWMKSIPGFDGGGLVSGPDVSAAQSLVGAPYNQQTRYDCSGTVARVIDRALGLPETGLMSTKNAADWLAARGFKQGLGSLGQISVGWYDHGPGPNDGHMAMTLSDGRNAESGGSHGNFLVGAGAAGASSPQFDQHMYLPTLFGEGPAGGIGGLPSSAAAAPGGGGASTISSGIGSGGGLFGGGSLGVPASLSGFGSFFGQALGQIPGQFAGQQPGGNAALGDLGNLGAAAGSFIDGQVSSALGVFGVPSTPGWLKGISQLIGGISIGGGGGSMPSPMGGTGDVVNKNLSPGGNGLRNLGSNGQQRPGPTYNIYARDTEDAFVKSQRLEQQKAAAKLDRF
ncbi:hypothetical protein HMPREF0591_4806 [Mycobacterium parascrofulaceum ATCC BAA-614]|uniref:NlpC/P60 domain-containing protein n=1 Tax=Mycobacterium parascrofulaceum ATCC BAA-614 TaxID=525368 RepID=D5PF62_9MYCO|nr:hypothetical protein [Mycobacterium parascrofulaceum]EFG75243.1 hypothetical protein HMPREF0591_4806 [Mycobacterium parascrofulaceum ATCC BAA-614]